MLNETESQQIEFGSLLQELIDRLSEEKETLEELPLASWLEQLDRLNSQWCTILRTEGLMPRAPDKDKENLETLITHTVSWLKQELEQKPEAIFNNLHNKCNQALTLAQQLKTQTGNTESQGVLDQCQQLVTQMCEKLTISE